jgi:hypothetical protein
MNIRKVLEKQIQSLEDLLDKVVGRDDTSLDGKINRVTTISNEICKCIDILNHTKSSPKEKSDSTDQ